MHASQADKNTFGADVKLHPVTKRPLEQGSGALPADMQAAEHCNQIEAEGDMKAADEMRHKLGIATSEEIAAHNAEHAEHQRRLTAAIQQFPDFHDRITALEENAAEHKALSDRIAALEAKFAAPKGE